MVNTKLLNPSKIRMSKKKVYALLFFAASLSSFSVYYLVLAAEFYTPGLAGISGGIIYTIQDLIFKNDLHKKIIGLDYAQFKTTFYWVLYIASNIPIFYFMLKWFSRRFFKLSILYLLINLSTTMFLTYVPGFHTSLFVTKNITKDVKLLLILFVALLAGILYGCAVGIAFKVGACTMGLDPVLRFNSRQKGKNLGPLLFAASFFNAALWIFIRYFIHASMPEFSDTHLGWKEFVNKTFLSPTLLGSLLFAITYSMVSSFIYSSTAKAEVFITTDNADKMSNFLNQTNYHRGHTLIEVEGGYTRKKKKSLKMIINMEEMYDVVEEIAAIDNKALITVTQLKRVYDIHDWTPMTKDDMSKQKEIAIADENRKDKLAKKYADKAKNKQIKKTNKKINKN